MNSKVIFVSVLFSFQQKIHKIIFNSMCVFVVDGAGGCGGFKQTPTNHQHQSAFPDLVF